MKRIHRLSLSFTSGILLSLPWLGFPGWILFVAFVPLLFLEDFFKRKKDQYPSISLPQHVFLATLVWNVLASWWMAKVSIVGVGSAMVFNAFLMAGVWWIAHLAGRKLSPGLGYLLLIALWISFEYIQFNWDIEWPCLQMGSVLADHVKLIQWYEYTGTFGGTLWLLVLNLMLFRIFKHLQQKTPFLHIVPTTTIFLLALIVPLLISNRQYNSYEEKPDPVQITIIQPNVDPYNESFDMAAEEEKLNRFMTLAAEVTSDETDFILGPETVFENPTYWNEANFGSNEFITRLSAFIGQYKKAELVFGVSSFHVYKNKNEATITAQNRDGIIYDRYNTALYLTREGELQTYHKSKLVAGVEKAPFLKYFPFLKNWFLDLGGASGNLGRQKEASNFVCENGVKVAPVICFESVFGEYLTDYVNAGAEVIFVITNDGWWKNSRGYKQHLLFSQLRAIETRRSIARTANTGTSCFINQRGEVEQATEWWVETAISGSINKNDKITFYAQYGDYIARVALFVSVMLVLLLIVRNFTEEQKKSAPI
ncbi:apolipoprotein N-acyltransferase [Maribellus sediminis]|uniref:apolipoprotein N-acyltransferase n=1 Tax=Maribellus sediminis TaxID=2696285 RepID=UPI00142FBA85|nr:apolipoprotein N-acyltransferase [Maribellus sediminis]